MTPASSFIGVLHCAVPCFEEWARQYPFRMTLCDFAATKPCADNLCDRDRQTSEVIESLDCVVWFTAFLPERVLYVNPAFKVVWGIDREALYANPGLWVAHIHPGDRLRVERTFASWIASDSHDGYEIEYRVVHEDHSVHTVRDVVSGLFDVKGNWCGSTGILEVITEQETVGVSVCDHGVM